jgi:hypothetical protein
MTLRSRDFKSPASTDFAIRAVAAYLILRGRNIYSPARLSKIRKTPVTQRVTGVLIVEAEVGIEPAYTDLQSAA